MKPATILYTSADVRRTIIDIFSKSKGRRVAIAAFVGEGAEAFLPRARGIRLVCWPSPTGTNPDALRELKKRGVKVFFSDRLHMKVYWTTDKGALITSANLSTNALGSGNLRELGILVPSGQVDIDRILRDIQPRIASEKELRALDKAYRDSQARNRIVRVNPRKLTFMDWYDLLDKPKNKKWKIGYWDTPQVISNAAKQVSKKEYGQASPHAALACRSNTYRKEDWVLSFRLGSNRPTAIIWQPVDYIVRLAKSEKLYDPAFPEEAVQLWSLDKYPAPPFRIERRFCRAFEIAMKKFGLSKFKDLDPSVPPERLIDLVRDYY